MKRLIAVIGTVAMILSMSGCSFANIDMESQLRAPLAAGEQSHIQKALEKHIYAQTMQAGAEQDKAEAPVSYVLKYPKMGDYRSAFVMKDINGDGAEDALAFYALQPEGANTHIALLTKEDNKWVCKDDIEGLATEIERIHFGDLNGDGTPELFAGFSMYNTRDRRLMLYTWEDDHLAERYSDTYTHMIVGALSDDTHDDLLLFRLNAEKESTSVRLLSMEEDTIAEKGAASLDGHINQFGNYTLATFDNGLRGVYQDCAKDSQTTITELVVWDGEQLKAPLYDPKENITTVSARESGLPCMDIDQNGTIEWPQSFRMTGDELTKTEDMKVWLSDWYAWDPADMVSERVLSNITVPLDDYYVVVPKEWNGRITAAYDEATHQLTVRRVDDGRVGDVLFDIVAFSAKT
ncbi:MAG: hypothetical protein IJC52_00680, partial [Clostridia bacterium]|nr:hypothetical protein [Clostridia bacterium]